MDEKHLKLTFKQASEIHKYFFVKPKLDQKRTVEQVAAFLNVDIRAIAAIAGKYWSMKLLEYLTDSGFLEPFKITRNSMGYVYIIEAEATGLYKIGCAKDPDKRLKELSIGAPVALRIAYAFLAPNCLRAEIRLHQKFHKKRVRGEWFRLDATDLAKIKTYSYIGLKKRFLVGIKRH